MTPTTADPATDGQPDDDQVNRLVEALAASARRLATLVEPLTPEQLRQPAYPSEWTIADVLSHVGSGGVITRRGLDGDEMDMQTIWDEWNAKSPDQQAADALAADQAFLTRLAALTPADRARRFAVGPMDLDLASALRLRLSEHALHTWDVAVTLDPTATVPDDIAELLIDSLGMMAGFAGRPTGGERTLRVGTSAPTRRLQLELQPTAVTLSADSPAGTADLELPAEALIRLVAGRLDPGHTPAVYDPASNLDELRQVFPGY
jgi:uncharacterized protein (TIGR03083 family)